MHTFTTQIESILNSRPLINLSDDPNNMDYLSPDHFLIGDNLTAIPETTLLDVPENRLNRWQRVEAALLEQMVQGLSESVATREEQMAETRDFSTTRRLDTITRRQHSTITLAYRTSSRRSSRR